MRNKIITIIVLVLVLGMLGWVYTNHQVKLKEAKNQEFKNLISDLQAKPYARSEKELPKIEQENTPSDVSAIENRGPDLGDYIKTCEKIVTYGGSDGDEYKALDFYEELSGVPCPPDYTDAPANTYSKTALSDDGRYFYSCTNYGGAAFECVATVLDTKVNTFTSEDLPIAEAYDPYFETHGDKNYLFFEIQDFAKEYFDQIDGYSPPARSVYLIETNQDNGVFAREVDWCELKECDSQESAEGEFINDYFDLMRLEVDRGNVDFFVKKYSNRIYREENGLVFTKLFASGQLWQSLVFSKNEDEKVGSLLIQNIDIGFESRHDEFIYWNEKFDRSIYGKVNIKNKHNEYIPSQKGYYPMIKTDKGSKVYLRALSKQGIFVEHLLENDWEPKEGEKLYIYPNVYSLDVDGMMSIEVTLYARTQKDYENFEYGGDAEPGFSRYEKYLYVFDGEDVQLVK